MLRVKLFACVFAFSYTLTAQSFFKPIPKTGTGFRVAAGDSVRNLLRPVVEVSAYGFPGNILLTGGGFSYQHLKLIKDRWKVIWSLSYLTWYDLKKVFTGLTFGILNNMILVGIAAHDKEIIGTLGIGINFNN